jgi:hypothetical protein
MKSEVEGFGEIGEIGERFERGGLRRWGEEARRSCGKISRFALFL